MSKHVNEDGSASRLNQMTDLLTVQELASLLKISKRTIYRHVDNGILPGVKIGNRLYFSRSKLMELFDLD